jgi:hypothetical protein
MRLQKDENTHLWVVLLIHVLYAYAYSTCKLHGGVLSLFFSIFLSYFVVHLVHVIFGIFSLL